MFVTRALTLDGYALVYYRTKQVRFLPFISFKAMLDSNGTMSQKDAWALSTTNIKKYAARYTVLLRSLIIAPVDYSAAPSSTLIW